MLGGDEYAMRRKEKKEEIEKSLTVNPPKILRKKTVEMEASEIEAVLESEFTPSRMVELLNEFCSAESPKVVNGDVRMYPDYQARVWGFDRVAKLKRLIRSDNGDMMDAPVTKITFNVINNMTVNKSGEVIDVNESEKS